MASSLEQFYKGLQFRVYGVVLETMSFKGTDGSTQRLVRVGCAGKTFSVFVDTDEELRKFDSMVGSMACCTGRVLRAKNSAAVISRLETVVLQNQSGWVNPTPSDLLLGCIVEGVVAIEQKKTGTFQGNPYSTVLFRAMCSRSNMFRSRCTSPCPTINSPSFISAVRRITAWVGRWMSNGAQADFRSCISVWIRSGFCPLTNRRGLPRKKNRRRNLGLRADARSGTAFVL